MIDYRDEFYRAYGVATGQSDVPSGSSYVNAARQFKGRWTRWLPRDRTAPVLDVGCGDGAFLYYLRKEGFRNVSGVDRAASQIDRARRMGIDGVHCADALEFLADKREEYTIVVALNLFEHLRKDEILRLLQRILQALSPGGQLWLVCPNGLSPFSGATRYWDFSHETGFTPASWRQLARVTGFVEPIFEEYGPIPHSAVGILRLAVWQGLRALIAMASYVEVAGPRDRSWVYTSDMKVILTKPGSDKDKQ